METLCTIPYFVWSLFTVDEFKSTVQKGVFGGMLAKEALELLDRDANSPKEAEAKTAIHEKWEKMKKRYTVVQTVFGEIFKRILMDSHHGTEVSQINSLRETTQKP